MMAEAMVTAKEGGQGATVVDEAGGVRSRGLVRAELVEDWMAGPEAVLPAVVLMEGEREARMALEVTVAARMAVDKAVAPGVAVRAVGRE